VSERNPAREIAFSLIAALVLGTGIAVYVMKSTAASAPQGPQLVSASAVPVRSASDDARQVATTFAKHLSLGEYDQAYQQMANAYRQTTSLEGFRSTCTASPFLSTAQGVSLSKTRQEMAPGQSRGSLSASGVLMTRAGTVDVTFWFIDDDSGVAILNASIAGSQAFPMGTAAPAKSSTAKPSPPTKGARGDH